MDAQAQLADLNDEIELLKLRLDIAEQEKCEAEQRVAGGLRACWDSHGRATLCRNPQGPLGRPRPWCDFAAFPVQANCAQLNGSILLARTAVPHQH